MTDLFDPERGAQFDILDAIAATPPRAVIHMGLVFDVTHAEPAGAGSTERVNAWLEANPGNGVLGVTLDRRWVICAAVKDKGRTRSAVHAHLPRMLDGGGDPPRR